MSQEVLDHQVVPCTQRPLLGARYIFLEALTAAAKVMTPLGSVIYMNSTLVAILSSSSSSSPSFSLLLPSSLLLWPILLVLM